LLRLLGGLPAAKAPGGTGAFAAATPQVIYSAYIFETYPISFNTVIIAY